MSRTSLYRPRRHRAVCHRPATGTRLLPTPHSRLNHSLGWGIPLALSRVEGSQERNGRSLLPSPFPPITPHLDSHYKRCPKALRLRLSSDQSPSRPQHGRSPDKSRHSLSKGHCQVRAPLTRRIRLAPSGDAPEHGVIVLPRAIAPPWATAPFSDSPVAALAGQSEQSYAVRLKINAPYKDSPVAALGEADPQSGGNEYTLPLLRMVEHFWWTGPPRTENFSGLLHILSEVRGKDSTVVTIGELRSTNGGHGSPLPSLRVVEHFWWTGLPHTENFSGLVHIPSEVRGCRRAVADVKHPLERMKLISTGVDAFSRNRPGPSITSPSLTFFSPQGACPPKADHSRPRAGQGCRRCASGVNPSPGVGPLTLSNVEGSSGGGAARLPIRRAHPPTPPAREKLNFLEINQKSRLSLRINQMLPPSLHPPSLLARRLRRLQHTHPTTPHLNIHHPPELLPVSPVEHRLLVCLRKC